MFYSLINSSIYIFYCEAKEVEEPAEAMETGSVETTPSPIDPALTPAEAFIRRQMQVADAKEQIATLCTAVISSPEDDVMIMSSFIKYC